MSRVGNAPIKIPAGVEVKIDGPEIKVKGPLGEMASPLPEGISLEQDDGVLKLKRAGDARELRQLHGLARALLNNNVLGVTAGWKKRLELLGVGYRVQLKGNELVFSLGFSHDVNYPLPEGVKAQVTDQTKIDLSGIDRQQVGQVAAHLRAFRPPEPYKGKGVRYSDETVRRKAGKAGKGKGK